MDAVYDLILEQVKKEANAHSYYYVLSFWFLERGLNNIFKFLRDSAKEELEHMDKFMEYYNMHYTYAYFPEITEKDIYDKYQDPISIFRFILSLERQNTADINNIANHAIEAHDNETYYFLQFFIEEQRESEDKLTKILTLLEEGTAVYQLNAFFNEVIK